MSSGKERHLIADIPFCGRLQSLWTLLSVVWVAQSWLGLELAYNGLPT